MVKKKTETKKAKIATNVGILSVAQLREFEKEHSAFNNAVNFDVIGRTSRVTEITFSKIYYEVTGFELANWNCNSCRLSNWKKLGQLYYKSLKYYEVAK